MKMNRLARGLSAAVTGGVLLTSGCTVKDRGTEHANQPPRVFFSTIPVRGTVFTKPDQFYWYATDRDGYIVEFQYALQPDAMVHLSKAGAAEADTIRAFLLRHPIDADTIWHWRIVNNLDSNGQTARIALPTSTRNPDTTVNTVVFVRARDDRGLLSTASRFYPDSNSIAYRMFGRRNRPPKTWFQSISVLNKSPIGSAASVPAFYSLDSYTYDTSTYMKVGYGGITINWIGSDSLDYPHQIQPPFNYFWELFGPFPNPNTAGPGDSTKLWASTAYPVRWPGLGSGQSPKRLAFTTNTSVTFYGLRGIDTLADSFPAYYFFRVRTRDDAGVLDPIGATNTFKVVHPRFDRTLLLLTKNGDASGDAQPPLADSTKIVNYYTRLIREAGYGQAIFDSVRDVRAFNDGGPGATIPESLLGRYKMVIFHKENSFPSTGETQFLGSLKAYMDAGGSVWGMGRDDLSDLIPFFSGPPAVFPYDNTNPIMGVGYFYFGAEKIFYTAHTFTVAAESLSFEEFIGADPDVEAAGFPALDMDTDLVKTLRVSSSRKDTSRYRELPGVNYFGRGTRSQNLYLFRSPVGVADTSHLHGKTVAFRSDRVHFKSAYFSFPLYFIRDPGASGVMRKMLEWFIGPPGLP